MFVFLIPSVNWPRSREFRRAAADVLFSAAREKDERRKEGTDETINYTHSGPATESGRSNYALAENDSAFFSLLTQRTVSGNHE